MSDPASRLPARPSLEQLRKQAKELLHSFRAGDAGAAQRFRDAIPGFAAPNAPKDAPLADAQFVVARELGFRSWAELARHVESVSSADEAARGAPIRPVELRAGRSVPLARGTGGFAPAEAAWQLYLATRRGDLTRVSEIVAQHPGLALFEYNYTPPLHFAVREGHADLVRFFLDRGADAASYRSYPLQDSLLTFAEDRGYTEVARVLRTHLARKFTLRDGTAAILEGAKDGDLARLQAELARDPLLAQATNETGDSALHVAAEHGHLALVDTLLAAGANPNAMRGDGFKPIHAVLLNSWRARVTREQAWTIADALLARGGEYNIYIAACRGDMAFVRAALARDDSLASFEDTCHHRPLSAAASRNDVEMVKLLLDHGADPNASEHSAPRGHALWTAVYHQRRELARMLVAYGADPNAMVESSGTPMMHARKDPELFQLLREHGGDEQAGDDRRLQGLMDESDLAGVERLLTQRPELLHNESVYWAEGVLTGAASKPDRALADLLLRLGARVPTVTKWGPEYYFKHYDMMAYLLERGMDANHMNWHRFTVLHHFAAKGDLAKVRLLLDHGANIHAVDEEYCSTPLGIAARWGRRDVVGLLLERGAEPDASGAPWSTPLAWARRRGHAEVEAALVAAGAKV
ncbi:MAG TPA: ankyrin repeat domain-containing protein [Gemmatimonadaceae bacterium]|nr:ankyrin repeat domain-containing protein [Gemmatimonadaceae bacterium]